MSTAIMEPGVILDPDSPEWEWMHYYCPNCFPEGSVKAKTLCGVWDDNPSFIDEDPAEQVCAMCLMIDVCPTCGLIFGDETDVDE